MNNIKLVFVGEGQLFQDLWQLFNDSVHEFFAMDSTSNQHLAYLLRQTDFVVVIVDDFFNDALPSAVQQQLLAHHQPYLYCSLVFNEVLLSAHIIQPQQACGACIKQRFLHCYPDRRTLNALNEDVLASQNEQCYVNTPMAMHVLVALLQAQVAQERTEQHDASAKILNLYTLEVSQHAVVKSSQCQVCQPQSTTHLTTQQLYEESLPFSQFRVQAIASFQALNLSMLIDNRLGMFNFSHHEKRSALHVSMVNLPLKNGAELAGTGRSETQEHSHTIAILEALERFAGHQPAAQVEIMRASYHSIREKALDPTTLGVHDQSDYQRPDFLFHPFNDAKEYDWVWGYSHTEQANLLLPVNGVYYGTAVSENKKTGFIYDTSNGGALGSHLSEAIYYGILEVIERDAFLLTWYQRLSLKAIDLTSLPQCELQNTLRQFELSQGYCIHVFDMTFDTHIPTVLALAKNTKNNDDINILCSAACHPDAIQAITTAINEVISITDSLKPVFLERKSQLLPLLDEPYLVKTMEDHALMNGLQEAESRFDFLLHGADKISIEQFTLKSLPSTDDLQQALARLIQRVAALGLRVLSVDQTTVELAEFNLSAARVVIPGMLPMTFGHQHRRLENLPRLFMRPAVFGEQQTYSSATLNPHPHPFY